MSDLLERKDAKLHRCSCGSWLYGAQRCSACAVLEDNGDARCSA